MWGGDAGEQGRVGFCLESTGAMMAFDETLAERIRRCLASRNGVKEKTLFGCACFLLGGNVFVGVWKASLIARVSPDAYEDALLEPHGREFNITGRPMRGWVCVGPRGLDNGQLDDWVQ